MSVPAKPGTSYPGRLEPVQQTWTRRRAHPPTGRSGGVNQSAIPYHFGGKEGVYLAVLEHVAGSIVAHLALPRRLLAGQTPAEALRTLMQDFVTALLGSETSAASSLLLAREQLQPSADFDALHTCLFSPLHHTVSELVTAIRSDQPDLKENILRAHAVLGRALSFAVAREALLRRLGENALSPQEIAQIATLVGTMSVAAAQG